MNTDEIVKTIRSGVSGIHISGTDHLRIDEQISVIANTLDFKISEWNLGNGVVDFDDKHRLQPDIESPSLFKYLGTISEDDVSRGRFYVIRNAYAALNNAPEVIARLQQELLRFKNKFSKKAVIILVAKEQIDFPDLSGLLVSFDCNSLASDQVKEIFLSFKQKHSLVVSPEIQNSLIPILSGLEQDKIYQILNYLKNTNKTFTNEFLKDARRLKKEAFSQSGLVEFIEDKITINQIGGLDQLKQWLLSKKPIMDSLEEALNFGVNAPKGVLIVGLPGCGKSICAKAAASLFGVQLVRLDIGILMGKYVGESESNLKYALKTAEQMSPCVLWIDEIEKAFAGVNGSGGSTEITTRLFGQILTWMEEKKGAVFVAATANNITTIPPELSRRFDEVFYVDLPNEREREQMFSIYLQQRSYSITGQNVKELVEKSKGFSGAEIERAINDSFEDLFQRKEKKLTLDVIQKHIKRMKPMSESRKEDIEIYRESVERFKPASFALDDLRILEINDSDEKERIASSMFLSDEMFEKLVRDEYCKVRTAALNNPNCPSKVLIFVILLFTNHHPNITEKELFLAFEHSNFKSDMTPHRAKLQLEALEAVRENNRTMAVIRLMETSIKLFK